MKFYKWPKTASLLDLEKKDPRLFEIASKVDGWTATEKIDGANFSIAVNKEEVRYASRNQLLNPCDNFFDLHLHLAQIEPIVNAAKETVLEGDLDQLVIYGEYYGEDVMNRIPYKTKGDFRFYSMLTTKDGNLFYFSFGELAYFFTKHGLGEFLVPIIDTFPSLESAMNLSPEFHSLINPEAMAEGFVILPVAADPVAGNDLLVFKCKSEKFKEKVSYKRKKPEASSPEELAALEQQRNLFKDYITESRAVSVISKMGVSEDIHDISPFVKAMLSDAWEEFVEDNKIEGMSLKNQKFIRAQGSLPYKTVLSALGTIKGE